MMLNEVCLRIHNFFVSASDIHTGRFSIQDGGLTPPVEMEEGQYYRVIGSVFNDGVHKKGDVLKDEGEFDGGVWLMRPPKDFLDLVGEMEAYEEKYGTVSPYDSESFGGYTYSRGRNKAGQPLTVFDAFDGRLNVYRKIRA